MSGIGGFFSREEGVDINILNLIFQEGSRRGVDGGGWVLLNDGKYINHKKYENVAFSDISTDIKETKIKDLILFFNRASAETDAEISENQLEESMQPLILKNDGLYLVNSGTVSNFIVNELQKEFDFISNIDSEAILRAYLKFNRDMKKTMEYLSGGFAFLMFDSIKKKLYAVCSHSPLYTGYVRGKGLFYSSTSNGVFSVISKLKNIEIKKNTINLWEDYYAHRISEYTIQEIDIDSGMVNEYSFEPRYVTNNYDCYKKETKKDPIVLVATSSGLDSTVTLATLKAAKMNPVAVHFTYGHRGGDAEYNCIKQITKILDVPLYHFDISQQMRELDRGMLTDKNAKIITGTEEGVKTTAAWTVFRNHLFITYMGGLAESLILKDNYLQVFLTGGFMQLSESGTYPDNSERFIDAALKFFKFSVTGTKLKPLYGMCNILKSEQYFLLNKLGLLEELSPWMISCDRPTVGEVEILKNDGSREIIPCGLNCFKDGKPACGSGLLSWWAAQLAGVRDLRRYYEIDDADYIAYTPKSTFKQKNFDIKNIIDRIEIPQTYKNNLLSELVTTDQFNKK